MFKIPVEWTGTLSTDNLHAGIATIAQHFSNSASPLAATQDIDSFAEYRQADDPLISRAPRAEGDSENSGANEKNVRADFDFGIDIEKSCENKRQDAKNQQEPKVDFPAPRNAL